MNFRLILCKVMTKEESNSLLTEMKLLVIKKKFDGIPNVPLPVTITANFTMHKPGQSYL
jgi:hypothetical protein